MRVRNHILRLLAGILLATGLFALEGQHASADELATIKERGTLVVGVKADYPPFGFRAPSGEIVGIEPDAGRGGGQEPGRETGTRAGGSDEPNRTPGAGQDRPDHRHV